MLICTKLQIESRIFDILQTILQIDESDLDLIGFEASAYGYDVTYEYYSHSHNCWLDDKLTILNSDITLILSFL